jgi:hypothetical protein
MLPCPVEKTPETLMDIGFAARIQESGLVSPKTAIKRKDAKNAEERREDSEKRLSPDW